MTVHVAIICGLVGDSLGGAERQVIRLANALVESGMRVTLISKEGPRESLNLHPAMAHRSWYANDPAESLAPRILRRGPVARGPVLQVIIAAVRRARRLKARGRSTVLVDAAIVRLGRWVRGPKGDKVATALYGLDASAVISLLTDPSRNVALATWDDSMPLIVAVRSDPARDIRAQPWEALKYVAYSRASVATVNARSLVSELARMPEIGASRARFVPNILIPNEQPSGATEQFLCVARLERHKRLGLAIRAFAEVSPDLPDWRLVVAGDGPER